MGFVDRIAIVGGPRTGKTTLSAILSHQYGAAAIRHTDDLIWLGWSESSAEAALWLDEPGPWVVEGVTVARAIRKWLSWGRTGKPCDRVIVLHRVYGAQTGKHEHMTAGIHTVLDEVRDELERRGVVFESR